MSFQTDHFRPTTEQEFPTWATFGGAAEGALKFLHRHRGKFLSVLVIKIQSGPERDRFALFSRDMPKRQWRHIARISDGNHV